MPRLPQLYIEGASVEAFRRCRKAFKTGEQSNTVRPGKGVQGVTSTIRGRVELKTQHTHNTHLRSSRQTPYAIA